MSDLPIDPLLAEICQTLSAQRRLVLAAPPGAGKTTRVPLALAGLLGDGPGIHDRILVLEPRRIAARLAAQRMAETLNEALGRTVGLSTRIERRVSKETRIEVITDGLFIRRLLQSPDLEGVGAVLFDEIHERSLNVDLGLALALEVQAALREDLAILAMSATLNTETLAERLDSPVIESSGRQYPVETVYLGRTRDRLEDQMAAAVQRALRETDGSVLAFLPGAGEIRRTQERLDSLEDIEIAPLYGALSPDQQDRALRPSGPSDRKVILATDIAESSVTIDGVSTVVDSGMTRVPDRPLLDGSPRLLTVRASKASVDQRRGRAGRQGPGTCYRLWDEAETRGLAAAPQPEILTADLSGLVLTLAAWGETQPLTLPWLDPPPADRIAAAQKLLQSLGALTDEGTLTERGHAMADLPLSPRLAALVVSADSPGEKALAARMAVLIGEHGLAGRTSDLAERLRAFERDRSQRARALMRQAEHWSNKASPSGSPARILAAAWPDRIARRRGQDSQSWVLANGRGGFLPPEDPLSRSDWLVVADLSGAPRNARITQGLQIDEADILDLSPPEQAEQADFDPENGTFRARRVRRIGAIILDETPLPRPSGDTAREAFLTHLEQNGFGSIGLEDAILSYCKRVACLRNIEPEDWPDLTPADLQASVRDWLGPALAGDKFEIPTAAQVMKALSHRFDWVKNNALIEQAPLTFDLPTGRRIDVDWLDDRAPLVEVRVQELYGLAEHPKVAWKTTPLTLQLLSPAGKPVAATQDIGQFWTAGYLDMAKDMRGRYPKHDWPDDPASAKPHPGLTKARLSRS